MHAPLATLLVVLSVLAAQCAAFTVVVLADARVCFYENLKKGDKMGITFQVEHGGNLDIDLDVS